MPPWLYSTHSDFISADAGTATNTTAAAMAAGSRRSIILTLPWLENFAKVSRRGAAKSRGFANESQVVALGKRNTLRSPPRKRGPRLGDVRMHSALKTR